MPARNTIEVIITGENRTDAAFKGVGDAVKNLGQNLQTLGVTLAGIGLPFAALATKAFQAFDEMDDAADQLDAVLKSTAGAAGVTRQEVLKMGAALQKTSTFTRAAVVSGENLLLTFTNIGSKTFPRATQALVDMATAMGTDVKSQAIQLGKALNDPIDGISALTRVGVTFTDQQKDMIKAMVEAGDVAGAQGVILDELAKEFGGSAAAQVDTMSRLSNGVNELFLQLGSAIQPIIDQVGAVLMPILEGITQTINNMVESGDNSIGIFLAIGAALVVIGPAIALIGTALAFLPALLAGPLLPIMAIVGALVLLADHFHITSDQIQLYLSLAVLYASYYLTNIKTAIEGVINKIKDWLAQHPGFVAALIIVGGFLLLVAGAVAAVSFAVGILTGLLGFLLSPIIILIALIALLLFTIEETYPGGIAGVLKDAGTSAQQLAYIISYYLAKSVNYIQNRLAEFQVTLRNAGIAFLDFAYSIVNNPFMQAIAPQLAMAKDQFNAMYDTMKQVFGSNVFAPSAMPAPIPFIPPVPPGAAGASAPITANTDSSSVGSILDLLKTIQQQPKMTVNFNGSGGPSNTNQANEQATMLGDAMRSQGVNP